MGNGNSMRGEVRSVRTIVQWPCREWRRVPKNRGPRGFLSSMNALGGQEGIIHRSPEAIEGAPEGVGFPFRNAPAHDGTLGTGSARGVS